MPALRAGAAGLSGGGARIHVLEEEVAVIGVRDVRMRVLVCTLWTDHALFGGADAGMWAVPNVGLGSRGWPVAIGLCIIDRNERS